MERFLAISSQKLLYQIIKSGIPQKEFPTDFFDIDIDIYISCLVLIRPVGQTTMSVGY